MQEYGQTNRWENWFNIESYQYEPPMEDDRDEKPEEDCESEEGNDDEAVWRLHSKDW